MNRQAVKSSSLKSIGYDPGTKTLEVEFASGQLWQYADVPAKVHAEMLKAKSVGAFFAANVRLAYPGMKVEAEEK